MKISMKAALAAAALVATPFAAAGLAQAQVAQGIATADFNRAVQQTNAYKTAMQQIQTTYKAQLDQLDSRRKVLEAELNVLVTKYQADAKANPNNPALKTQEAAITAKQQSANEEIQRLSLPIARVQAFVNEQFDPKVDAAIKAAMTKKKVGIVVAPQAITAIAPGNDLTPDITAELNTAIPTVSIAVPANWQPGQQRPAAAPTTATPQPQPQGR